MPRNWLLDPAVVMPVPPLPIGRVPVTPVVKGRPVTLVITPDAGVPSAGVVKVGEVSVLLVSVCARFCVTNVSFTPAVSGKLNVAIAVTSAPDNLWI